MKTSLTTALALLSFAGLQTAGDAYSAGDLREKRRETPEMQYRHKKPKHK